MGRAIILVMDSFGIGATADADKFGDEGSNTLGSIARIRAVSDIDNLNKMPAADIPTAAWNSLPRSPVSCSPEDPDGSGL